MNKALLVVHFSRDFAVPNLRPALILYEGHKTGAVCARIQFHHAHS